MPCGSLQATVKRRGVWDSAINQLRFDEMNSAADVAADIDQMPTIEEKATGIRITAPNVPAIRFCLYEEAARMIGNAFSFSVKEQKAVFWPWIFSAMSCMK